MEHKILILNGDEQIKTVAAILVMNGYTVRVNSEMVGNRKRKVLEYWRDERQA